MIEAPTLSELIEGADEFRKPYDPPVLEEIAPFDGVELLTDTSGDEPGDN